MSETSIADLMAQLSGGDPAPEKKEEPEPEEVESEGVAAVLEDFVTPAPEEAKPEEEPVKKKRTRRTKAQIAADEAAAAQAAAAEEKAEVEESETATETEVVEEKAEEAEVPSYTVTDTTVNVPAVVVNSSNAIEAYQIKFQAPEEESRTIFILTDAQILDGYVYRRGQKITYQVGDKFYNSQTDRNGYNWLDKVDDPQAQYSYFGRLIAEPDSWSGTPIGDLSKITHPGIALAVARIAQEELRRNGAPFN